MSDRTQPGATLYELERALKLADPSVLLVPSRILRRVIRTDQSAARVGLIVPHRKTYLIDSAKLLTIADRAELGLRPGDVLPPTVILIDAPDPLLLAELPRRQMLLKYWRLLFHARVHQALASLRGSKASPESTRRLGPVAFEEVRAVLHQERFLFDPRDDTAVYEEFIALFLELWFFDAKGLPFYFPSLEHPDQLAAELDREIGATDLFYRTRLRGAPDENQVRTQTVTDGRPAPPASRKPIEGPARQRLIQRAENAANVGNRVRAALLYAQLDAPDNAAAELKHFANRLTAALHVESPEVEEWRTLLAGLLALATADLWPAEARLLFDLQKVCTDRERDIYAVDVMEWALSLGQRPLRRRLPGHQEVLILKHLRNALGRLPSCRIEDEARRRLAELLTAAIGREEDGLREQFRPVIHRAIEEVGLAPHNYPEQCARGKLIEELLDHVCERGFLTMGDLRDALSRNQLKLADLSGPSELVAGDCLIRLNRRLAVDLDGIYHHGEVYLRWLQRLSSTAFGTPPGRFLTRYVALPFGGAFIILEGLQEIVKLASAWLEPGKTEHAILNPYSFTLLGLFLFALLHIPAFRNRVAAGTVASWRGVRWLCLDLPARLLRLQLLQRLFASTPFQLCKQYVLKPLGLTLPVTGLILLLGGGTGVTAVVSAVFFVAVAGTLNTRLGYALEETCTDWLIRLWRQIEGDILPGLFWLIVGTFKGALNLSEQMLYAVDEWLRFRQGDSRLSMTAKMVLGVVWFFVTYLIRVFVNLFVEPTFNPIKHFPVVTVAAKLIVPAIPFLSHAIHTTLRPVVGGPFAGVVAGFVIFFLPGFAGFLVWELKENWRLYRANRAVTLRPAAVGHHGETVTRLLKRGFHSGTVPKLYTKLRKDWRKAFPAGPWRTFRKHREALHAVEHAMCVFFERDFIALLHGSKGWGSARVEIESIHLACSRIVVRLACREVGPDCVHLAFTVQNGELVAEVLEAAWLAQLGAEQLGVFRLALAGQYKLAGTQVNGSGEGMPFAAVDLTWDAWVQAWEQDQVGKLAVLAAFEHIGLLPGSDVARSACCGTVS
jgi:hypothetical protein